MSATRATNRYGYALRRLVAARSTKGRMSRTSQEPVLASFVEAPSTSQTKPKVEYVIIEVPAPPIGSIPCDLTASSLPPELCTTPNTWLPPSIWLPTSQNQPATPSPPLQSTQMPTWTPVTSKPIPIGLATILESASGDTVPSSMPSLPTPLPGVSQNESNFDADAPIVREPLALQPITAIDFRVSHWNGLVAYKSDDFSNDSAPQNYLRPVAGQQFELLSGCTPTRRTLRDPSQSLEAALLSACLRQWKDGAHPQNTLRSGVGQQSDLIISDCPPAQQSSCGFYQSGQQADIDDFQAASELAGAEVGARHGREGPHEVTIERSKLGCFDAMTRARNHLESGAPKEAIKLYTEVLEIVGQKVDFEFPVKLHVDIYRYRALSRSRLHQHSEADDDCTTAISLDPSYDKAWLSRATVRFAQGRLQAVLKDIMQDAVLYSKSSAIRDEADSLRRKVEAKHKQSNTAPSQRRADLPLEADANTHQLVEDDAFQGKRLYQPTGDQPVLSCMRGAKTLANSLASSS